MKKIILFFITTLLISFKSYGIDYVSNGAASANWSLNTSWIPVGIPGANDNVTILAGHTRKITVTSYCTNLTVSGILQWSINRTVVVKGDYTVALGGSELGTGKIQFNAPGTTITVNGTSSASVYYAIYSSRTITAGSVITKASTTTNLLGGTLTNLGTYTLGTFASSPGTTFINSTGAILSIKNAGFMSGRTFVADALGNTVVLRYTTGAIPTTTAGYYNLTLAGTTAGTKTLPAATIIGNKLTIGSTNTLNSNGYDLTVGGDWVNSGAFTAGTRTVTFNGTSTVSGTSTTSFKNIIISGTLTGHATTMNIAGNFTNNGTYTHNSGTIVFNGTTTVSGASTTTFNNITISGTLTGHATTMNVAGNFANNGTYTDNSGTIVFNGVTTVSGASTTTFNNITITGTLTGHSTNMNLVGDYVNNGTYNNNSSTLTFNGTAVQTISGISSTTFENLTINNTAGVGTGVSISSGTYTLNGGLTMSNGTLSTGGNSFTMTSTPGKTAYIAEITGTGAIAGDFIIETDLRGGAASWADISSPVSTTTFGEWVATGPLPAINYTYTPPTEYPTQYTFDNAANDFSPAGAGTTISTGIEVYLSGNFTYGAFGGATVTSTGVPTQGDQAIGVGAGDNLVGNPFACSISWAAVSAASPGITGFDIMDAGSYVAGGAEIPAGQGFWVYGAGTLNIPESAKTSTATGNVRSQIVEQPYFTLKLSSSEYNVPFSHILKVAANSLASDGWNSEEDHLYRKSPVKEAPSLYTPVAGKKLIINQFNNSNETYSMPVIIKIGVPGHYKFEAIDIDRMSDYSYIRLEDKFLNKMVELTKENSYPFEVTEIGDEINRFVVHFSKNENFETPASISMATDFINQVEVLPSLQGNVINFNLSETTPTSISVTNIIGQPITDIIVIDANNQSVSVSLPEGFTGMYIIRIESAQGSINKKFIKK